jgi:uncharacterized membrane protein (DUF2068 family)
VLELVEGGGLFYRKRWAEWLTVVATSLLVPLEVYESRAIRRGWRPAASPSTSRA